MTLELWAVAGLTAIWLLLVFGKQLYNDKAKGAAWALSNRDDQDMSPTSRRLARAAANHVENVVMFAPLATVLVVAGLNTSVTGIAALAFLACRAGHALTYALGVTHIRSGFWIGGVVATVVTGWPLIRALFT
ncbi:MAPEG family protein [uncultured Tateyamaria sp.]|uniref:MAPEG family protein n=1 Tax=uncultured Tateyamaria sp. TaxID=455651 RepID=UPI002630CB04|nr:MAPEG family protein [uncultured Tateyamaria sp.]